MSKVLQIFTVIMLSVLTMASIAVAEFTEVMVPMRDGVKLATNVSLPDGDGPWPVILTRTPYNKDGRAPRANANAQNAAEPQRREQGQEWLSNGYAYVSQDVRGQFKSEGQYRAFADDMNDGYDTIEWIATQPWCNGKVGMVGGSATGITANMAAMSNAPHLVCAHVTVAHGSGYRNSQHPGGVYLLSLVEDWMAGRGVPPAKVNRPIIRAYGDAERALDIANYYSKITIPMYNVGGWYDIFLNGNVENFVGLHNHGAAGAKGNQKLVMGAFGHGRIQGNLKYPDDAGRLGGNADQMRFFDHWMKGADNGIDKEPAVRYYVMGDTFDAESPGNEWRTADNWPPLPIASTAYLLQAGNRLVTAATPAGEAGDDAPAAATNVATSYIYDPNNPVPTVGGNNLSLPIGPMDQREVSGRPDVIKFETAPLEHAVEIVGPVNAELFVSTTAEDTDFIVKLVDVYPDGYEALVRDQGTRLRFRDGMDKMVKAEPGKVYKVTVDLWSTALVFNKGHKIAIHVQSSNSRRFEPHSNTWEPVADYATQAVKATNTIHHSPEHPSKLVLPVTKVY